MVEVRQAAELLFEAVQRLGAQSLHHLEGDGATVLEVERPVNDAHAAAAQLFEHLVARHLVEGRTGGGSPGGLRKRFWLGGEWSRVDEPRGGGGQPLKGVPAGGATADVIVDRPFPRDAELLLE